MNRTVSLSRVASRTAPRVASAIALSIALMHVPHVAHADSTQTTEQLANEAYEQVSAGKFTDGIATYLKAYEISHEAVLLLNVSTIYDHKLKERGLAIEYYRRYAVAPGADPDRVKKVTDRIAVLRKEEAADAAARLAQAKDAQAASQQAAAQQAATQSQAHDNPPKEEADGSGMRTAGVVIGIIGVAGVAGSIVFGALAKGKNDDANAICNGTECSSDRGVTLAKSAGTFATASTISFIAGLALVGTGITLYVVAPKGNGTSSQSAYFGVSPAAGAGSAGLTLHGGF